MNHMHLSLVPSKFSHPVLDEKKADLHLELLSFEIYRSETADHFIRLVEAMCPYPDRFKHLAVASITGYARFSVFRDADLAGFDDVFVALTDSEEISKFRQKMVTFMGYPQGPEVERRYNYVPYITICPFNKSGDLLGLPHPDVFVAFDKLRFKQKGGPVLAEWDLFSGKRVDTDHLRVGVGSPNAPDLAGLQAKSQM